MATIDLTNQTFKEAVKKQGVVLVDFWASWCRPCTMFAPVFSASSEDNPEIVHAKVDTEAERGLGEAFQVTAIPTLLAFRDGILVFRQAGALPAPALQQVIDAVRDLDMNEVRANLDNQVA